MPSCGASNRAASIQLRCPIENRNLASSTSRRARSSGPRQCPVPQPTQRSEPDRHSSSLSLERQALNELAQKRLAGVQLVELDVLVRLVCLFDIARTADNARHAGASKQACLGAV